MKSTISFSSTCRKLALAATLALAASASAATTFVSSAGSLGATDTINWGVAGPSGTTLSSGFSILSVGGLTMTVSTSNGTSMERRDQGSSWSGNFAPGATLLWNQGNQGNIIIDFSTGIFGFGGGTQAQSNFFGAFTGFISAFDATNTLLGTHAFNGTSTSNGDNSAVFAGIFDSAGSISRLVIGMTTTPGGGNDFAIGNLLLNTNGQGRRVPDAASTLPLLGLALAGLVLFRRRLA